MNSICRSSIIYPVLRLLVPEDKVSWNSPLLYSPPNYSADHLKNCSWADPDISDKNFKPKWNAIDGGIIRESFDYNQLKHYEVANNYPLNPRGRTGLRGRGRLGRWGPNHAADAIVTRWKRDENKDYVLNETHSKILQFLAILRKDCNKWAIPGGFLNENEAPAEAAVRELFEEAISKKKYTDSSKEIQEFFSCGNLVYKGYVDDQRNTDNAWIETTASNFHDNTGNILDDIELAADDDAADVKWIDICKDMDIYETHHPIIKSVYNSHLNAIK